MKKKSYLKFALYSDKLSYVNSSYLIVNLLPSIRVEFARNIEKNKRKTKFMFGWLQWGLMFQITNFKTV